LREVKDRFKDNKQVYDNFLEIMKQFKAQQCVPAAARCGGHGARLAQLWRPNAAAARRGGEKEKGSGFDARCARANRTPRRAAPRRGGRLRPDAAAARLTPLPRQDRHKRRHRASEDAFSWSPRAHPGLQHLSAKGTFARCRDTRCARCWVAGLGAREAATGARPFAQLGDAFPAAPGPPGARIRPAPPRAPTTSGPG
jgi:hypothetical protein